MYSASGSLTIISPKIARRPTRAPGTRRRACRQVRPKSFCRFRTSLAGFFGYHGRGRGQAAGRRHEGPEPARAGRLSCDFLSLGAGHGSATGGRLGAEPPLALRSQSAPQSEGHRRHRSRDTEPCSRSCCRRAEAGPPGDCRSSDRPSTPWCAAGSVGRRLRDPAHRHACRCEVCAIRCEEGRLPGSGRAPMQQRFPGCCACSRRKSCARTDRQRRFATGSQLGCNGRQP